MRTLQFPTSSIPIRNFLTGFLISFIGTLPIGYLNLIALQLYLMNGLPALVAFILGVVLVEVLVVYFILRFIEFIKEKNNFQRSLKIAAMLYLLFIGIALLLPGETDAKPKAYTYLLMMNPFALGALLNLINPMQIVFWSGWNATLVANQKIDLSTLGRFLFLISIPIGTALGMALFAGSGGTIISQLGFADSPFVTKAIGVCLIVLSAGLFLKQRPFRKNAV
jgi:threonine/homoserine/homoserine lactone efflux protein